ncbi:MAG: hypothetical protein ACYDGM_09850 [Vulcanimicrobiaceae bacterium]
MKRLGNALGGMLAALAVFVVAVHMLRGAIFFGAALIAVAVWWFAMSSSRFALALRPSSQDPKPPIR